MINGGLSTVHPNATIHLGAKYNPRWWGYPFSRPIFRYNIIAEHLKQVKGWQSKNPLMMIYRALAEWKNGKSKVASETLSGIKGKSWESKVNAIRDGVGSCC